MPELPDVEVFRRYLDATSLKKRIEHAWVPDSRVLDRTPQTIRRALTGSTIESTSRHGKHLFAHLDTGRVLVLHFGMTGRLAAYGPNGERPEHALLEMRFEDDSHLAYLGTRKLGSVDVADSVEDYVEKEGLGPDAREFDADDLAELLGDSQAKVKSLLMNQSRIAGLGNVYTDEVLFQAGVHPESSSRAVAEEKAGDVSRSMHHVLNTAVDKEADPDLMPDTWLLPRRGDGGSCPRCDGELSKMQVNGRPTWICESCQKKYD